MHELSIAISMLDAAEEESQRLHAQVVAIHLRLGALSGVDKAALRSAFELAREDSAFPEAALVIEDVPLIAWCPVCGCEQKIPSVQQLACPVCLAPTPDIVSGRELEITGLEIVDEPDTNCSSSHAGAQAE